MTRITIRDAAPEDKSAWRILWDDYLAFYQVDLPGEVTEHTWMRLMDPLSPLNARLAVKNARIIGFAIHQHHPSSWVAGDDCYLEDLFVSADARGSGAGRALLDDLIELSRIRGWHRLYWHTSATNKQARALYDRYVKSDGHIRYRMHI